MWNDEVMLFENTNRKLLLKNKKSDFYPLTCIINNEVLKNQDI